MLNKPNLSIFNFRQDEKVFETHWFKNKHLCGVTAGASTPDWIIEKIIGKISEIKV